MEFFINELSLEGQFHSDQAFEEAVVSFIEIFSYIREKIKEKKIYKDSLFANRTAVKNESFLASFNRIKNRDIKNIFKQVIFDRLNPRDWRREQMHPVDIDYRCPMLDDRCVTDTSVAETAERKLIRPTTERILINFTCSQFEKLPGSTVRVIKVAEHYEIIDVPFVEKKEDLHTLVVFELEPIDSYLRNPARFRKTAIIFQGRSVFEEIETKRLWYLDNFHKNHFEVFDKNIKHLGEANLEGNFLERTRDPKKDKTFEV